MPSTSKIVRPLLVLSAALVLAGCGPLPGDDAESASPTPAPGTASAPAVVPSAEPTVGTGERPTAENISCDSMLEPLVDAALRSTQLAPAEKEWSQFGFEPTGAAIECPWGYPDQPHAVTYFAWSALAEGEAATFLALTADNGYTTTEDERGTWVVGGPGGDASQEVSGILVTDDWIAMGPNPELISAILWTR